MSLFDAVGILAVLLVVGALLVLGARLRIQKNIAMLLVIIAVLFLGLISLSKLTMTLFGIVLLMGLLAAFLIMGRLRRQ
jgi:hypothetical protein